MSLNNEVHSIPIIIILIPLLKTSFYNSSVSGKVLTTEDTSVGKIHTILKRSKEYFGFMIYIYYECYVYGIPDVTLSIHQN